MSSSLVSPPDSPPRFNPSSPLDSPKSGPKTDNRYASFISGTAQTTSQKTRAVVRHLPPGHLSAAALNSPKQRLVAKLLEIAQRPESAPELPLPPRDALTGRHSVHRRNQLDGLPRSNSSVTHANSNMLPVLDEQEEGQPTEVTKK